MLILFQTKPKVPALDPLDIFIKPVFKMGHYFYEMTVKNYMAIKRYEIIYEIKFKMVNIYMYISTIIIKRRKGVILS